MFSGAITLMGPRMAISQNWGLQAKVINKFRHNIYKDLTLC